MSDRERWIVYPLLFFSLAIGFRNVGQTGGLGEFRRIECQQLLVKSPSGENRMQLVGLESTGSLAVLGKNQHRTVVINSKYDGTSGSIEVRNVSRPSWVILNADPDGGRCEIKSSPTEPSMVLGLDRETQLTGLFAYEYNRQPCEAIDNTNGVAFTTEADRQFTESEQSEQEGDRATGSNVEAESSRSEEDASSESPGDVPKLKDADESNGNEEDTSDGEASGAGKLGDGASDGNVQASDET